MQYIHLFIELKTVGTPDTEAIAAQISSALREMNSDYGYIVYIHKATLKSKTFKIERNKATELKLVDKAKSIYRYKRDGILPPAEAMIHKDDYWFKSACDYCNHLTFCLNAPEGEIIGDDEE